MFLTFSVHSKFSNGHIHPNRADHIMPESRRPLFQRPGHGPRGQVLRPLDPRLQPHLRRRPDVHGLLRRHRHLRRTHPAVGHGNQRVHLQPGSLF